MQRTVNIYSSQLINNWVIQGNVVRIPLSRSLLTSGTTTSLLLIKFLQESVIKTLNIVRAPNVGTEHAVHVERVFGCRNKGRDQRFAITPYPQHFHSPEVMRCL